MRSFFLFLSLCPLSEKRLASPGAPPGLGLLSKWIKQIESVLNVILTLLLKWQSGLAGFFTVLGDTHWSIGADRPRSARTL